MSTPSGSGALQPRLKRQQVSRACDSCRSRRIKCNTEVPCSQCKSRGNECSKIANPSVSSLSQARSEIDRLREEVRELRRRLQTSNNTNEAIRRNNFLDATPPETASATPENLLLETVSGHGISAFWSGIQLANGRQPQTRSWHGPSSLMFFMSRIADFLSTELHRTQVADDLTIKGRTRSLLSKPKTRNSPRNIDNASTATTLMKDLQVFSTETPLSPTQEDYFLDFYWTSIHADSYPILDEKAFKDHYRSLWQHGGNSRAPSALVDIVLALCMQAAFPRGGAQGSAIAGDEDLNAGVAGRWYYKRCQLLLVDEMDSPTIATLQCHLLSSIYLCSGSFHNMSDTACSLAVRTAYMLGLHLDPSNFDFSSKEQEYRRRLWWATYVQDCKIGLKLGRPFLLLPTLQTHGSPSLLSDTMQAASDSGSYYAPLGNGKTWLTFHLCVTKLYSLAKSALHTFYNNELPHDLSSGHTIWNNPKALHFYADLLSRYIQRLREWTREVPQVLHLPGPEGTDPFSTKQAALSVGRFAPVWIQRQRLTLKLMYHHLLTCLCRPFIKFTTPSDSVPENTSAESRADKLAVQSAEHATTLVRIYHEAITTTSLLNGRNEPFQWLWSAVITLVGFLLAYQIRFLQQEGDRQQVPATAAQEQGTLPLARNNTNAVSPNVHQAIIDARHAVDSAAGVFDILGDSLGETPIKAAKVVRSLLSKLDAVAAMNRNEIHGTSIICHATEVPDATTTISNDTANSRDHSSDMDNCLFTQPASDLVWADITTTQEWFATTQDIFESAFQIDDYSESINFNDATWQLYSTDMGNIA